MLRTETPIYTTPNKDSALIPKAMKNDYPRLYLKFHAGRENYWPVSIIGKHVSLEIFNSYVDWLMAQFAGAQKVNSIENTDNEKRQLIKFSNYFDFPSDIFVFEMTDLTPGNWEEIQESKIDEMISKTRNESGKQSDFIKSIERSLGRRHPRVIEEKDKFLDTFLK